MSNVCSGQQDRTYSIYRYALLIIAWVIHQSMIPLRGFGQHIDMSKLKQLYRQTQFILSFCLHIVYTKQDFDVYSFSTVSEQL